jgi:hypothetical protein
MINSSRVSKVEAEPPAQPDESAERSDDQGIEIGI